MLVRADTWRQQVLDVLIVDLEVGDMNVIRYIAILLLLRSSRKSPLQVRGIRPGWSSVPIMVYDFPGTRLTVSEDARVVAIEIVIKKLFTK